jgi:dihydropteroate synthase
MKIGNRLFDVERNCYVMGILNVTPDSFSDGGKWNSLDRAVQHAGEMIEEGAAILDIGGESTRPGHVQISTREEIQRVVPVIEAIKNTYDIPVSIDSYKSEVVEAALEAGADLVNDIWGLKYDPRLAGVIANYNVPCCLMHNRSNPDYEDFLPDLLKDLEETLRLAKEAGISEEQIILDPGVGFGKTYAQNLAVIHHLEQLQALGYPVLLGTSRKSCIGLALDLPADQRVEGTLVTTVMGVQKGASFVRVHDVKENVRAIQMTQAILREGTAV